jgi:hypothetical protein
MEKQKLQSAWELAKSALKIYFLKQNFIYLTKINLFGILASLAIFSPLLILGFVMGKNPEPDIILVSIIAISVVSIIASIVWGLWVQVTTIIAISQVTAGKTLGVKETFSLAWPRVGKYALTTFLVGIIGLGGFLLLIIPGILFLVWYSFANFIVITEGIGAKESLKQSKLLVKGYFWQVVGRGLFFTVFLILFQVAFSLIPFIGPVVSTIFRPFYFLPYYLLYSQLQRAKGVETKTSSEDSRPEDST